MYGTHTHSYHKVIYCASGSITFGLPDTGESITIVPGDRLDVPAGVQHMQKWATRAYIASRPTFSYLAFSYAIYRPLRLVHSHGQDRAITDIGVATHLSVRPPAENLSLRCTPT